MTIPSEAALDALTLHGVIARKQVFDEAGEQMAVVRQAISEGRAVIKHIFVPFITLLHRSFKHLVCVPELEHLLFQFRKVRVGGGFGVR